MSLVSRLNKLTALRNTVWLSQRSARLISTSPKKSDTATITTEKTEAAVSPATKVDNKNWVSWGWDYTDEKQDRAEMNASFFFSVTLCLVIGSVYFAYTPDNFLSDWSQREAFLELRRREAAGLEPISPDYVDPAAIDLPSEEELGEFEIVI